MLDQRDHKVCKDNPGHQEYQELQDHSDPRDQLDHQDQLDLLVYLEPLDWLDYLERKVNSDPWEDVEIWEKLENVDPRERKEETVTLDL